MTTAFSMRSIEEVELQRSRWRRARKSLRLVDEEDECFATGGLGQRVPDLVARLLVLPFDPEANLVSFDAGFWEWWTSERQTPLGRQERVGLNSKPTAYGAAIYDVRHSRDAPNLWDQFLALTRSASIDAGFRRHVGRINENGNWFFLINLVGRVWSLATRYTEVVERFKLAGPFEGTLALRQTAGAYLGNVGEGWKSLTPGTAFPDEIVTCHNANLIHRIEFDEWPADSLDIDLVFPLGERIEDSWGIRERRFIARAGPYEDQFDAAKYS